MMKTLLCLVLMGMLHTHISWAADTPYNVLLIISDDMRPEVYDLGNSDEDGYNPDIKTPRLNEFMAQSVVFNKTYAQQSVCGPSRASFLTGRRPNTIEVGANEVYFRDNFPDIITIPNLFRDHLNFTSYGLGKIFHSGMQNTLEEFYSWSTLGKNQMLYEGAGDEKAQWGGKDYSWLSVPEADTTCADCLLLPDQKLVETAKGWLEEESTTETPFFMALGLGKPHLPFVAPSKYFDMYSDISPPKNAKFPTGGPDPAFSNFAVEIGGYSDVIATGMAASAYSSEVEEIIAGDADNSAEKLELFINQRRAYFAAISYIDGLVGEVLDKLEALGLDENTVVAFLGDHGFHLMENGEWCKGTTFEIANRVPFMIRKPNQTPAIRNDFVELVDLFPTLTAAAGVTVPEQCSSTGSDVDLCTDGMDVLSVSDTGKQYAFSQFPRTKWYRDKSTGQGVQYAMVGYSAKSEDWRYTAWVYQDSATGNPMIKEEELYDHIGDQGETVNLASDASYCDVRKVHWKAISTELQIDPDNTISYSCS